MVITYVDARHPGANHDAFIWKHSTAEQMLNSDFNNGKINTWLLGDSGYPLEPYLMTPFRLPGDEIQRRFSDRHAKARNIIGRCFGVLKNKFRCIISSRGLQYSTEKASKVINACCELRNVYFF
ncbi:putative nuclease HARBI1 [Ceratitis capitata]|uniref:putative nuclease HARBI1 n=1 Tax=Ceratitis capitata TaxID=7213 RepID=UPI000A0F730A|nr:putative nuclease HARBI1 [Ceratitis capitata]